MSDRESTPSRKLKRKKDDFYAEGGPNPPKKRLPTAQPVRRADGGCERCSSDFYDTPCEQLARSLLGCTLVRETEGGVCWGRIVETEAYLGGEDKGAHSYNGRRTERNEAMYMPPGTAYVYSVYGMHCCFNVSSRGGGAAVLIRALEPLGGVASMRERRKGARKDRDLCNGPAKLCQAMAIDKKCNKLDLVGNRSLWVERLGEGAELFDVVASSRVGIDYAEEWAEKPLRFYIKDCSFVSKATNTIRTKERYSYLLFIAHCPLLCTHYMHLSIH